MVERTFGWLSVLTVEQGLRRATGKQRSDDLHCHDPPDGQATGASASASHGLTRGSGGMRVSKPPDAEQVTSRPPCLLQIVIHVPLAVSLRRCCAFASPVIAGGPSVIRLHPSHCTQLPGLFRQSLRPIPVWSGTPPRHPVARLQCFRLPAQVAKLGHTPNRGLTNPPARGTIGTKGAKDAKGAKYAKDTKKKLFVSFVVPYYEL